MAEEQSAGAGEGGGEHEQAPERAEIERQAREIGWKPKDQWKGDQTNWVDADVFLEKSKTFMPYLQHERQRLRQELEQRDARQAALEKELKESRESMEALKTFNEEMAAERKERRKAEIGSELRAAREANDDVRVAELTNELNTLVKPAEKAPEKKPNGADRQEVVIQPWVKQFIGDNADFFKDPRKVALWNVEIQQRRAAGDTRVGDVDGTAFLNESRDAVEKILNGSGARRQTSRTEEPHPAGGTGGGSRGGKSYNDMPKEARDKCDSQEKKFVGAAGSGKAFKTQAEWRAHYAQEFFSPSTRAIERAVE